MKELELPKPLAFPVPFPNVPFYLVACNVPREVVPNFLGPPMLIGWIDGLGDCDFWAFEYPCGLQVALQFLHHGKGGIVVADSPEINHLLRHIPFSPADCVPIDDDTLQSELKQLLAACPHRQQEIDSLHAFQVWRQDDNGNAFKVGEPTSERDAKCWVQHFESLGHKQTYWYSRANAG